MAQKLVHKRSSQALKAPTGATLDYGEIAVNYNVESPFLSIKNSDNTYSKFSSDDIIAAGMVEYVSGELKLKSDTGHTHDDRYYTETEVDAKIKAVNDTIEENELITSTALNELNERVLGTAPSIHTHKKSDITDFEHTHGTVTLTGDVTGSASFGNGGATITTTIAKNDMMNHMISVTYDELVALRNNNQLIPGQQYRITDYVTTTAQENTQSAGHQFDVIVTADNATTLNEVARACLHEGDTYFSEVSAKLEAWKIWYSLDNDAERFAWALNDDSTFVKCLYNGGILPNEVINSIVKVTDTSGDDATVNGFKVLYIFVLSDGAELYFAEDGIIYNEAEVSCGKYYIINGKGVIYRMIDEWNNDCPYDFKNIQFKRKLTDGALDTENGINTWCYTFNAYKIDDTNIYDASVIAQKELIYDDANRCYGNVIKEYYEYINNEGLKLNDIVFLNTYSIEELNVLYFYCYSNSFGERCYNNSFGDDFNSNSFGCGCHNNTLGNSCNSNSFGDYCNSNSFGNNCYNNSFGHSCRNNTLGYNCYNNSFGNYCRSNSFGDYCDSNSFGNNCYNNSFGNYCDNNYFGNNCYYNSFGGNCGNNSFGSTCNYNSFGDGCTRNSFENSCYENSFGGSCICNSFGNDCESNYLGYNCYGNSFGNYCWHNSFGYWCSFNSFGNGCHYNSFRVSANTTASLKNYVHYNHFEDSCSYNVIWNNDTTSNIVLLKNININREVSGTRSSFNYINIDTINSEQEVNVNQVDGIISIGNILSIKYESLETLRDSSQLIPGRQYRIIDYVTTTSQENTRSARHTFDIIVTALNEYTLSEEAQAVQHINDSYFDDSNLSAWKIWYCLYNDTDRFAWAGDEKVSEIEHKIYDSSECTINSDLIDGNVFITPFNFESCVWVDGDGDGDIGYGDDSNHDEIELVYEWGYFTDENDNTHLCLYKSDVGLYEEEGQPDYGDKYLYRGVVNVDGTDYDYWQKWDATGESLDVGGNGDYVYATTARIVSNPEAYSVTIETESIYANGKGVIYRMIDEFGNDCPYDFKNIQFKRKLSHGALDTENGIDAWCYTFNAYCDDDANIYDASVIAQKELIDDDANRCYRNIIKEYYEEINNKGLKLNDIVFLNIYSTNGADYFHCFENSFGGYCHNNSFSSDCQYNSFGGYCHNNSFGSYCQYNSFKSNCSYNIFGNTCYDNSFGSSCLGNSFKSNCSSNIFGTHCYNNSFGNDCYDNSFGNHCYYNSFENYCNYNSFGNDCHYNSFGNHCYYNSFGNNCRYNSFRLSASTTATLKDYVQYNHFDDGCSFNIIWNSDTTSSSVPLKNINVNKGVSGAVSLYNFINVNSLNQDYEIQVAKNSKGELKIYCEADLIA